MTNKDIKDYCKNCDVEPPAMKFKCPECEYNPDNEQIKDSLKNHSQNFSENSTQDKEQIMIDGANVSRCKYLPYCNDKQGNCAFEPNCYFKQLARKTQIVEQQQKTIDELIGCVSIWEGFTEEESKLAKDSSIADLIMLLRKKTQECEQIKEKYEALKLENEEGYEIVAELKHECEELKNQLEFVRTHRTVVDAEKNRYLEALEEIETLAQRKKGCLFECKSMEKILDIINKAKGGRNE